MKFQVILLAFLLICAVNCSKILVVFPTLSISHVIPLQSLAKGLAKKGHEITFVSAFPQSKPIKNYRDIKIPYNEEDKKFVTEIAKDTKGAPLLKMIMGLPRMIYNTGNITLNMPEMKKLMKEENFDLLIAGFFMTEFVLGLGDHFQCPTIVFSPAGAFSTLTNMIGNPISPEGAPHFAHQAVDLSTFIGRVKNFLINTMEITVMGNLFKYFGKQVYYFNFPPDRYRSYEESLQNVSLVFLNTHFSSIAPRPFLPNMIEVGGIQVKPTPSPLPDDLKKFLDEAEHGAILFTLGSNAKSSFLPKEVLRKLLGAFSKVKQRILMKWESDVLEGKPDNVFISQWLPQDDVLAHKNLKAFISHCGYGGVIEAKYHGVPIIGVPFFGDQPDNAAMIEQEGWGIKIDIGSITEESLKGVIEEIINNPKYSKTVKRFSELAKDRPQTALETGIYWTEYIIRHRGAPHISYPAAKMNLIQKNSLDVLAFIFAAIFIAFKVLGFIFKKICCGSKDAKLKVN